MDATRKLLVLCTLLWATMVATAAVHRDDALIPGRVAVGRAELAPFPMDWANASKSVVDLSRFLDAPAGKDGFITTRGPHLIRPDGTRFRIWGVNLCGPDCFPDHEEAPLLAADLARFGVNCVRFHFMDVDWGRHLFDAGRDDSRHLDMLNLDRLDFFIALRLRPNVHRTGGGDRDFVRSQGRRVARATAHSSWLAWRREFYRHLRGQYMRNKSPQSLDDVVCYHLQTVREVEPTNQLGKKCDAEPIAQHP
jgi:hypothetical protein